MNHLLPPDKTPQEEGREFEDEFAKIIGGTPIKMSGAGFTKQDVNSGTVLWQNKHTRGKSVPVNGALFADIDRAINGPGGIGGDVIPGVASRAADGEIICSFRLKDLLRLQEIDYAVATTKPYNDFDLSRRTPALLRED